MWGGLGWKVINESSCVVASLGCGSTTQNACNDRVHHQVAGWAYLPVAWYVNLTRDGNPGVQFERTPVLCLPKPGDAQDEDFGRVGTGLHVSSSFMRLYANDRQGAED